MKMVKLRLFGDRSRSNFGEYIWVNLDNVSVFFQVEHPIERTTCTRLITGSGEPDFYDVVEPPETIMELIK
jgi:hypothetical protein